CRMSHSFNSDSVCVPTFPTLLSSYLGARGRDAVEEVDETRRSDPGGEVGDRAALGERETPSPLGRLVVQPGDRSDGGIAVGVVGDRKSTRLNSSHVKISYAVFCMKIK